MFRATMCSSSGGKLYEYNFWPNHSVIVACIPEGHYYRVIMPEVVFIQLSSWGWAHSCSKHVEDLNKGNIEETVRQIGYLPELYEDSRPEKYWINFKTCSINSQVNGCRYNCMSFCESYIHSHQKAVNDRFNLHPWNVSDSMGNHEAWTLMTPNFTTCLTFHWGT
jgi:hypothetical protein